MVGGFVWGGFVNVLNFVLYVVILVKIRYAVYHTELFLEMLPGLIVTTGDIPHLLLYPREHRLRQVSQVVSLISWKDFGYINEVIMPPYLISCINF